MILQILTIFVSLACYFEASLAKSISCPAELKSKKVELRVQYDRDDVGVYTHKNTNLVNVLIPFVNVTYVDPSRPNLLPLLNTTIEGLAATTKKRTLQECDFVLKTSSKHSGDFSIVTQRNLFITAKSCLESKLCDQLRGVTDDDVLRSGLESYDFGENSVFFNLVNARYSNIQLEKKRNKRARSFGPIGEPEVVQSSLNALVDFALVAGVSLVSSKDLGRVTLPDQQKDLGPTYVAGNGHFKMSGGSLGDLTQILRTQDVKLSNDGLRYTLSIGLQLPNVDIRYNNYKVKYVVPKSGKASINITDITLGAQIVVNYNTRPCNITAGYIRSKIGDVKFELSNGNWLADKIANSAVNLAIDTFIGNIVDFVKHLLRSKVAEALKTVDCEKFRPRLD